MKTNSLFLISILLLISACKSGQEPEIQTGLTFNDVIENGGGFDPSPQSNDKVSETASDETQDGELWRCKTETYRADYAGGGTNGFPLFNPNASVIYPGSLLQGKSLSQATPDVIAVDRAGGTISIDILDGSSASYFEVDKVSKSSITQASNNIINGSTGAIPANMEFSYSNVQSKEQMAFEMNVDYQTAFTEIEGKLSFSQDREYNRTIVQLKQSYYTMSFDIPTSVDGLFAPTVQPEDLEKYVGPGNPATYISDVTYGRIYYLLIESTSSSSEMDAAISASFSGVATGGGVDAEVSKMSDLKNLKVKLFAFGGEASSTILTISSAGNLSQIGELLSESTDIRTGKAISYVVRSVYDNQIVSVSLNTEYDVTTCEPLNPNGPPPPYLSHWTGMLNTFGAIGAAATMDGSTRFILFNEAGDEYLISENNQFSGPFDLSQLSADSIPLNSVGAAAFIESSSISETIMLFDKQGINYAYYATDSKRFLGSGPISALGTGNFPFNLHGISAALNYGIERDALDPDYYTNIRAFFENNHLRYSLFYNRQFDSFGDPKHLDNFVLNESFPFAGVEAGIGFTIGSQRFRLLFNEVGDRYMIAVDDWNDYYIGPFRL